MSWKCSGKNRGGRTPPSPGDGARSFWTNWISFNWRCRLQGRKEGAAAAKGAALGTGCSSASGSPWGASACLIPLLDVGVRKTGACKKPVVNCLSFCFPGSKQTGARQPAEPWPGEESKSATARISSRRGAALNVASPWGFLGLKTTAGHYMFEWRYL